MAAEEGSNIMGVLLVGPDGKLAARAGLGLAPSNSNSIAAAIYVPTRPPTNGPKKPWR